MAHTDLKTLKGIGDKTRHHLGLANIHSVEDLLLTMPKSYEDYIIDNETMYVGKIVSNISTTYFRVIKSTFKVEINNSIYNAVVFQKPYIQHAFQKGDVCLIKGDVKDHKQMRVSHIKPLHKQDKIESKYHIDGVLDHRIRETIKQAFDSKAIVVKETIPLEICATENILSLSESYQTIHNPKDYESLDKAFNRLKIEEIIEFYSRVEPLKLKEFKVFEHVLIDEMKHMISNLAFELTTDQINAIREILIDLNGNYVLERLIQGDVGSGKTIVAFLISLVYIERGYQVAFMAPTEVLSEQHATNFKQLFPDIRLMQLTSNSSLDDFKKVEFDDIQMIIGTHALAYPNAVFKNLGLVIIDEQHKFGVEMRKRLRTKSKTKDLLYLTATPIPRSLMHVMYGHATVSSIKSMPLGRQKITSLSVHTNQLERIHEQVKKAVELKQHVFFVVPAIHFSEKKASITSLYEDFHKRYGNQLFVLHGQMNKTQQLDAIKQFRQSLGGVLLSTTMVEVGIDIKTATFMIVLDADHFGTSQLHQLRGRIGRGTLKGVFYMVSKDTNQQRLTLLETHQDGFTLSEKDLEMRGAGNLGGLEQSGKSKLKLNDFLEDFDLFMFVKTVLIDQNKSSIMP